MTLKKYQEKRTFTKTPEPKGKKRKSASSKSLLFVVQKHAASHLHYDFRLEVNGVLKSWAIPKGPSLNPNDKRLAIMVEDHPYDYHDFEGVIPAGNYGAGTVMVWDEGNYLPLDEDDEPGDQETIEAGLIKGGIHFILEGKKLRGKFSLIKLARADKENEWLLIKSKDGYESSNDVLKQDQSAATGRSMEEIASNLSHAPTKKKVKKSSDPLPQEIKPMLTTLVDEPFDGVEWLFEIKWDGFRAIAEVNNQEVKLYSRNLLSFNEKFKSIVQALKKLKLQAVFDGEIVVINEKGNSNFQDLQNYQKSGEGNLTYVIFDLLYYEGQDLRDTLTLIERKKQLEKILPKNDPALHYSSHVLTEGKQLFKEVKKNQIEGIIAKKIDSFYTSERSKNWLKIKTQGRQEAVICGFTKPRGSRNFFGALILGVREGNQWRYIGHTGTGFTEAVLSDVAAQLKPLITTECPFSDEPPTNNPVTWIKPKLLCEVGFSEWTKDNQMRHPVFLGLRQDKMAKEVKKEQPVKSTTITQNTKSPHLTHLDKLFWPKEKITKGDLIAYYKAIAPYILPYLKDRPQVLHRYPNGIDKAGFYQKNMEYPEEWLLTHLVKHSQEDVNYLLINDEKSLLYAINLGCIDLNPFSSRIKTLQNPDYLIIDLDPEKISFNAVVETALAFHELLEEHKIPGYCKTSGATGMHILIPMGAKYTYEQVKQFAHLLSELVHEKLPRITSLERSPAKRQKRVYLDYLQNNFGQTIASVYSVRPREGASVSTPLEWSEVKQGLNPQDFNIHDTLQRVQKKGDIFSPVLGKGIDLLKILKQF